MTLSLLDNPLLSIRSETGEHRSLSLPEVLAGLGRGEGFEFTALRPHQQHGWYAFLVQVAALVVHRSGVTDLARSPAAWREALLGLGGEGPEAWSLCVEDLSKPAFLQTTVPEGSLAGYRNRVTAPDAVDVVITAKNHDVKQERIAHPRPEHWIYALVTLQTMEGFLGRGNYGIARMNGGFASRPAVAAAPGLRWAERLRRDVQVWLGDREILIERYGYAPDGTALLWTLPWDGKSSYSMQRCDPFFIEVCRRVRLVVDPDGRLEARTAGTEAPFLDAKQQRGDTGDIWTPVKTDPQQGTLALTVSGGGFSYRLMTDLLFTGDYSQKPALALRDEDGPAPILVAQVLVRGQGKTDGYHSRLLPMPERVRLKMASRTQRESLGGRAKAWMERASTAERRVLRPALCALLQGGKEELDFRDARTGPWVDRMDEAVDATFFDDLWATVDLDPPEADVLWDRRLHGLARAQFDHAARSAPVPLAVLPRALARAELLFRGLARKHLPGAIADRGPGAPEGDTP